MPGPAPKLPGARRRQNVPALGEWREVEPLERPVLGPLPRRGRGEGAWSPRTRGMWEAWTRDPVTALWGPADTAFAIDTAHLFEQSVRTPRATLAGEIRLRLDSLGLTPRGRRGLRWRIAEPGEVLDHPAAAEATARTKRSKDRGNRLRAVDPAVAANSQPERNSA